MGLQVPPLQEDDKAHCQNSYRDHGGKQDTQHIDGAAGSVDVGGVGLHTLGGDGDTAAVVAGEEEHHLIVR